VRAYRLSKADGATCSSSVECVNGNCVSTGSSKIGCHTVFDVVKHEGMTCIVMELLEGETPDSYLARNGFIRAGEVSTLLLPAMRGVAAAHAQGVIHRDLKPQNIFICIESNGRVVTTKALDFGISIMVEQVMDASTPWRT
jgi:serine/threonine protein kinase